MRFAILVTASLLATTGPLFAQTAQLSGRITDTSASVVPGVTITVVHRDTGAPRSTVSNGEGYYTIPALPPGIYNVSVLLEGFAPVAENGLQLVAEESARADFVLTPGTVTEQVVVTATSLLETGSADVGSIVTQRSIHELPLNVRDPISLVTLTPGVTTLASFGGGGGTDVGRNFFKANFRVAGGRNRGQDVLLDGVANVTGDQYVGYTPPVDGTQEFKVETNGFSSEFGRTSGGILTVVTRSGTNQMHGSAYEYHRNDSLDSPGYFTKKAGLEQPDFKRNQFGGAGGGPIKRNRTFFFGSYEGLRQQFPQTLISTVPTLEQRAGDFSQTRDAQGRVIVIYDPLTTHREANGSVMRDAFPGNRIPSSRFDAVGRNVLLSYPEPNQPGNAVTGANNYAYTSTQDVRSNNYSGRVDHQLTGNQRLFARVSWSRSDAENAARWPGQSSPGERTVVDRYVHAIAGDTIVLSPSTSLDIRGGFARAHADQVAPQFDPLSLGFPAYMSDLNAELWPNFTIADVTAIGNGFMNDQPRDTYSLVAQVNRSSGSHLIKAGTDIRVLQFAALENTIPAGTFTFSRGMTQGPIANQASATAGHGVASLLLGAGASGSVNHVQQLFLQRKSYAFYLQDDWRVSSNLTLNMGLRYDVDMGMTEREDRLTWWDDEAVSPLAQTTGLPLRGALRFAGTDGPRNQIDTDWNNLQPRIGFAYSHGPATVIRAGYGVFYGAMPVRRLGSIGFDTSTPWVNSLDGLVPTNYLSNPFPQGFNLSTGTRDPLTNVGFNIDSTTRSNDVGYTQQWSVSLERQIGERFAVELSYLGNRGTSLQSGAPFQENQLHPDYNALGNQLNELVPNPFYGIILTGALSSPTVARRQLLLPYPQYTTVSQQYPNWVSSFYHGMVIKGERRLGDGLTFLGSYVWSKLIDDGSEPVGGPSILNFYDRRAERGLSPYDTPHNLVASAVYDLPFGRGRRFGSTMPAAADAVVGGWTVSTIVRWQSGVPISVSRPSVRQDRDASLEEPTIDRWFDTTVFSSAAPFTFGNVGRTLDDVRADGVKNVDMTFSKNVRMGGYRFQLRADMFNLFNRTQFAAPNGTVTNAAFGTVNTQANSAREVQLGLKFYW